MCGNDYTGHLSMFTIGRKTGDRRGRAFFYMKRYCQLTTPASRLQLLHELERDNKWSDGVAPPAENYVQLFCRALATVMHYPVYRMVFSTRYLPVTHTHTLTHTHSHALTDSHTPHHRATRAGTLSKNAKRQLFAKGEFSAVLHPLNAFRDPHIRWTAIFPNGWGADITRTANMSQSDRHEEATFKVWARGPPLVPVPYPRNTKGQELAHGALLDFETRKVVMHSDVALRRWLTARNVPCSSAKRHTYLGATLTSPHPNTNTNNTNTLTRYMYVVCVQTQTPVKCTKGW